MKKSLAQKLDRLVETSAKRPKGPKDDSWKQSPSEIHQIITEEGWWEDLWGDIHTSHNSFSLGLVSAALSDDKASFNKIWNEYKEKAFKNLKQMVHNAQQD